MALMGMMLAIAVTLSWLEACIPPIPALPPGVKLGLANIVTMYVLFFLGKNQSIVIAILRSGFVLLTRGPVAAAMSLSGGLVSVGVMLLLTYLKHRQPSFFLISIAGALSHNLAQLALASLLAGTWLVVGYLPLLLVSGVVMGSTTGLLLRTLMPVMGRLQGVLLPHEFSADISGRKSDRAQSGTETGD